MNMCCVKALCARLCVLGLIIILVIYSNPAEAKRRHSSGGYNPPSAAMVVDVKTGRTLYAQNENALRHPASITKVMTLYLLFEQLERGRFTLDSPLRISAHAASQPPSKLGLDAGETIRVEDAIKALVTKSANDIAVAVAENIAGSEEDFAEMMTRKARAIGMPRTVYRNASGLPDSEQVTTAKDLTVLARAVQDRFPRYYSYFGTRAFNFAGENYRNHNKLLGRIEGVDGIKTGYTRASGFNLMTSAKSDGHHIVAIVLGGRSGGLRDRVMAGLIETHLPRAYAGNRTAPVIADSNQADNARVQVASLQPVIDIPRPRPVNTKAVEAVVESTASMNARDIVTTRDVVNTREALKEREASKENASKETVSREPLNIIQAHAFAATEPSASVNPMRWIQGAQPLAEPKPKPVQTASLNHDVKLAAKFEDRLESHPAPSVRPNIGKANVKTNDVPSVASSFTSASSGWVIQLGATDDEGKAKSILNEARNKGGRLLAKASPFTEKVVKGSNTLYRARFSGFEEGDAAQEACNSLKKSGFSCFASRS